MAFQYPLALFVISALVFGAERLAPWRKDQRALRPGLASDVLYLVFNGHFLGVLVAALAIRYVIPALDGALGTLGLPALSALGFAASWPVLVQIPVALVATDLLEWCVHNLLHRVPWLWELHKAHHSVVDGEMDWLVSFRFHWAEVVVYRSLKYLPLAVLGFGLEAVMFHAVFGTLIGHLNHANLDLGHGPWRYVLNNPRMHIWHHDRSPEGGKTVNFGIIFSAWDWIFGTARVPPSPPPRIGFDGVEQFPRRFFCQASWPVSALLGAPRQAGPLASVLGAVILGGVAWCALWPALPSGSRGGPSTADDGSEVMLLGEPGAASQPAHATGRPLARSPRDAEESLARLGQEARAAGFSHPEHMVSAGELAAALGSSRLVVLDVRPRERFAVGHIPSARLVSREDYEEKTPIPGLSVSREKLQALLRRVGVRADSTVVLHGDGGPEPYRLWWTLREVGGFESRVLDGGLAGWKALGLPVAEGAGQAPDPGDVVLPGPRSAPMQLWSQIEPDLSAPGAILLDTRTLGEYRGEVKHPSAARPGRIPGAVHLDWELVLRGPEDLRLRPPAELLGVLAAVGVEPGSRVVTSCQSGTRSAVAYFALHELGWPADRITNYGGSWAEYSRLPLPAQATTPGPESPAP